MKKSNISTYVFSILSLLLVACIVTYPREAFASALDGLKLWFNVVCPALLPFFICVEILIGLGIVSLFGSAFRPLMRPVFNVPGEGSFGFFMSISSGYPVGSRITAKLRQDMLCSRVEGQRLLSLCSTSGPLFIIGAVATGIMNNPALGFFLAIAHYLSAITVGFFMRYYRRERIVHISEARANPIRDMLDYRRKDGRPIGLLMGDAVKNGVNLILMIGGFIIFFSVITRMLQISGLLGLLSFMLSRLLPFTGITQEMVSSFLIGVLEVTNGVKACAVLQIPLIYKAVMVSFMIGFGGLSVNAQVMSIIAETDLSFPLYLFMKTVQGIIASAYSFIIIKWFSDLQVFNLYEISGAAIQDSVSVHGFSRVFAASSANLLLMLLFLSAVTLIKRTMMRKI